MEGDPKQDPPAALRELALIYLRLGLTAFGGPVGAVAATVGIFLPSFVFVALSARLLPDAKQSNVVRSFMDGVNVASLAILAVVAVKLGQDALRDGLSVALAAGSLLLLVRYRVNSAWLMAGGALIGLAGRLLGFAS